MQSLLRIASINYKNLVLPCIARMPNTCYEHGNYAIHKNSRTRIFINIRFDYYSYSTLKYLYSV